MSFDNAAIEVMERRFAQPARHRLAQDTLLTACATGTGDDQDRAITVALGMCQELTQASMGRLLGHAVQIERGIDRLEAALEPSQVCALDAGMVGCGRRRCG